MLSQERINKMEEIEVEELQSTPIRVLALNQENKAGSLASTTYHVLHGAEQVHGPVYADEPSAFGSVKEWAKGYAEGFSRAMDQFNND